MLEELAITPRMFSCSVPWSKWSLTCRPGRQPVRDHDLVVRASAMPESMSAAAVSIFCTLPGS